MYNALYMYTYIYVYIHICIHTYMYTYMYIYILYYDSHPHTTLTRTRTHREVQHDKEGALVCYRSWFLIHRSAIIAGFTIGLLFVVILWVAYCITGKCGTCAGEVPGYRRHLK